MANPEPKIEAGQKLVRATVARGRSIDVPVGDKIACGTTAEGKPVTRLRTKVFLPNSEVELPEAEVIALRKAGFLVDPEESNPPPVHGARVVQQAA